MENVKLKFEGSKRIEEGYPMVVQQDFLTPPQSNEGELVRLTNQKGKVLAHAYLGEEKRSAGWILPDETIERLDVAFFIQLFTKAKTFRENYFAQDDTTAFRLFNGEGDGLGGMLIDYYEGFAVIHWYNKGIYSYIEPIIEAMQRVYPMIKGVYEKKRFPDPTGPVSNHLAGERAPEPLLIKENGIRYAVYLNDGLMTGIFLDQRHVRGKIMEEYAVGKKVLNLFSYTGAFSVSAAMGGAVQTISVDVANRSLARTKEQFEVNGLDSSTHEIRVMDVFDYISYALRHQLTFDLIVSDPPTFARTKKRTFSVEKEYTELIEQYIDLTTPHGLMILSANTWKMSHGDFKQMIEAAFKQKKQAYTIVEELGLPEDFKVMDAYPEGEYLKVFVIQKK